MINTLYIILIAAAVVVVAATMDLRVLVVEGPSMEPAYRAGERVLVDRYVWQLAGLKAGDVVVFDHPLGREVMDIKRVSPAPSEAGTYMLLGDNARNSEDSRQFGSIPKEYIRGRVIIKL